MWPRSSHDCAAGTPQPLYEGGRVEADRFVPARWDLLPQDRYMWASVQTVRGCPKHCSFCSVWRTDGQKPRQRGVDGVIDGDRRAAAAWVPLHRAGRRQLLSGDAERPGAWRSAGQTRRASNSCEALRAERFELMARLAELPDDMVFFTQITMEAAEDPEFLDAMRRAQSRARSSASSRSRPKG